VSLSVVHTYSSQENFQFPPDPEERGGFIKNTGVYHFGMVLNPEQSTIKCEYVFLLFNIFQARQIFVEP
jgi:hypothetical protein